MDFEGRRSVTCVSSGREGGGLLKNQNTKNYRTELLLYPTVHDLPYICNFTNTVVT